MWFVDGATEYDDLHSKHGILRQSYSMDVDWPIPSIHKEDPPLREDRTTTPGEGTFGLRLNHQQCTAMKSLLSSCWLCQLM